MSRKDLYLRIMYMESIFNKDISNKTVAERLSVAPATVTEMVVKLEREGYIKYTPYKKIRLTTTGKITGKKSYKSYLLWRIFLANYLGFQKNEIDKEFGLLNNEYSDLLVDRLHSFITKR